MNVLIACEESQEVCKAFRERGHRAFSADLQECSGGHPEWHIQGDVLPLINGNCSFVTADTHTHTQAGPWDLLIAHPPCTFLSNAGAVRLYPGGKLNRARYDEGVKAKEFFLTILKADCERIAIENPVPSSVYDIPHCSQVIQPYQFGEPWSKKTCLWLKGLPQLVPTNVLKDFKPYVSCGTSANKGNPDKAGFSRAGGAQKVRSRTFPGVAAAMADQWTRQAAQISLFDGGI